MRPANPEGRRYRIASQLHRNYAREVVRVTTMRPVRMARTWTWPYRAGLLLVVMHIAAVQNGATTTERMFGIGVVLMLAGIIGPSLLDAARAAVSIYRADSGGDGA